MQRVAMLLTVKEGMNEKYKEAHLNVWPEILEGIKRVGISNYSAFMLGRQVYTYFEVQDLEKAMTELATDINNQRWQEYMAPMMEVGIGLKEGSTVYLEEIFHID
jgi:L-rhamnose mutarotase